MILQITLLTSTALMFVAWRATRDYYRIKNGEKIDHPLNATVTIIWTATSSWLITHSVLGIPYFLSLYWLFFDLLLNKLRGKDLLYVGTTAWLDKSFHKISWWIFEKLNKMLHNKSLRKFRKVINKLIPICAGEVQLTAKLICLAVSIVIYFIKQCSPSGT